MHASLLDLQKDYMRPKTVAIRSGDTVKVTQKIKEASKERLQAFEGLVIRVSRSNSVTCRVTLRKVTSGVGVEKSFLLHSPNVVKVEILRRAKVRRNYLSYMRQRVGKAARLKAVDFDKQAANEFAQAASPLTAPQPAAAGEAATATETEPAEAARKAAAPKAQADEKEAADDDLDDDQDDEADEDDEDDGADEDDEDEEDEGDDERT